MSPDRYCGADAMAGEINPLATKGVIVPAVECERCKLGCPQAQTIVVPAGTILTRGSSSDSEAILLTAPTTLRVHQTQEPGHRTVELPDQKGGKSQILFLAVPA